MFARLTLSVLFCSLISPVLAQQAPARNVILVTLDGMRWQEVFRGIDAELAASTEYNRLGEPLGEMFNATSSENAAQRLFPFLHEVIASKGVLIGNRDAQSCAQVTNPWFFSYPGYNEILTGEVDASVDSNDPIPNKNVTFLEWLNKDVAEFRGKVRAFASWDVFPAIINAERSGVPVNVGPSVNPTTDAEKLLARLPADLPTLWPTVRMDAFTHHSVLNSLAQDKPRVIYISYGETDDFAHEGHYEQYLLAAHRTDRFLREIWDTVQGDPFYRDNTVLLISTDHGRGEEPIETWQHHASKASVAGNQKSLGAYENGIIGSDAVWMAAIGAGVPATGPVAPQSCVGSNQIASTLLTLLGLDPKKFNADAGAPIAEFLRKAH